MKNTEVKGLLSQLRTAADAIKAQIQEADSQIAALTEQRRVLTNMPVSKTDFMEYVRADIQRRAASYQYRLTKFAQKNTTLLSFAQLERVEVSQALQPFPYLDGEVAHAFSEVDPSAFYWHFGELIAERFEAALGISNWPDDAVPAADRRLKIADLDKQSQELQVKRDELSNDLVSSGMYE